MRNPLAHAALAEAATPYGIESFDDVLEPLWRGIRSLRGKVLAAFLKAIGHIIPLMDAEHAFYYTREVRSLSLGAHCLISEEFGPASLLLPLLEGFHAQLCVLLLLNRIVMFSSLYTSALMSTPGRGHMVPGCCSCCGAHSNRGERPLKCWQTKAGHKEPECVAGVGSKPHGSTLHLLCVVMCLIVENGPAK
eukprot:1155956-Pelagomonas_calceolata.AAC.14